MSASDQALKQSLDTANDTASSMNSPNTSLLRELILVGSWNPRQIQTLIDADNANMIIKGYPLIHYIILNNDEETLIQLLKHPIDLNSVYLNGETPFTCVVGKTIDQAKPNMLRLMLEKGGIAEIHKKKALLRIANRSGWDSEYSSEDEIKSNGEKDVCMLNLLLDHMNPNNPWDHPKESPTLIAARRCGEHIDILKILIERNFFLNYRNKEGIELIHIICKELNPYLYTDNFKTLIDLLLNKKVDINAKDSFGKTCLYYALDSLFYQDELFHILDVIHKIRGFHTVFEILFSKRPALDVIDNNGKTILLYLLDHVKKTLESYFFTPVTDYHHFNIVEQLFRDLVSSTEKLLELFLENGYPIDLPSNAETFEDRWKELYQEILMQSSHQRPDNFLKRGLINGAPLPESEPYVLTSQIKATHILNPLNTKIGTLHKLKQFLNLKEIKEDLEVQFIFSNPEFTKKIINTARHRDGKTLLHLASEHRHPQLFVELLRHNADDTLPDKQKIKPIDIMSDIEKTINALIRIKIPKIQLIHTELQTLYSAEQKNRTDSDKKLTKDKEEKGSKELSAIQREILKKSKAMIELGKDCLKDILTIKKDSHFGKYMKEYCEDYCAILYRLFYQKDILRPWFDAALTREFIDNIPASSRYFIQACHFKTFLNLTAGPASKPSLSLEDEVTEDPTSEHLLTLLNSYPSLADIKDIAHRASASIDSASVDKASLADVTTELEKKSEDEEKTRLFQALVNQFIFNKDSVTPIPGFTGMNATSLYNLLNYFKEKFAEQKSTAEQEITRFQLKITQLEKGKDTRSHAASRVGSASEPTPSPAPAIATATAIPASSISTSGSSIPTSSANPPPVALSSSSASSAASSSSFEEKTRKDLPAPAPSSSAAQSIALPFVSASSSSASSSSSSSSELPSGSRSLPNPAPSAPSIILTRTIKRKRETPEESSEENPDLLSEERSSKNPRKEKFK